MLGARSGLQTLVCSCLPNAISMHCIIHRQALALKTLSESLQDVLNTVIRTVNFVKNGALNTCLLRKLCSEMNAEHLNLLYHSWVCWLSKSNVLAKVFELLKEFLNRQRKYKFKFCFKDSTFISKLAYVVDIFDQLNNLILKLQRRDTTVLGFIVALNTFVQKLENWKQKAEKENFAMFETLSCVI